MPNKLISILENALKFDSYTEQKKYLTKAFWAIDDQLTEKDWEEFRQYSEEFYKEVKQDITELRKNNKKK